VPVVVDDGQRAGIFFRGTSHDAVVDDVVVCLMDEVATWPPDS
jgi:hypothetical protein